MKCFELNVGPLNITRKATAFGTRDKKKQLISSKITAESYIHNLQKTSLQTKTGVLKLFC